LFKQGEKLYAKKKYDAAAEKWRKAKPLPLHSQNSRELKLADALYYDEKYIEAAAEYENFRKLHPKNPKAPYALYMRGLCNYYQVEKIDIDQTPVKNAVVLFEMFLQEYPDSDMTPKVREKLAECKTRQADYEMYVGKFYYRTDKYDAAIGRLEEALQKYPVTPHSDEALFLLGNAYLRTSPGKSPLRIRQRSRRIDLLMTIQRANLLITRKSLSRNSHQPKPFDHLFAGWR
jgi:outer membrane protein assembly factor BamD